MWGTNSLIATPFLLVFVGAAHADVMCANTKGDERHVVVRVGKSCKPNEMLLGSLETLQALLAATVSSADSNGTLQFRSNVQFLSPIRQAATAVASAGGSTVQTRSAAVPIGESVRFCDAGGFPGEVGASLACTTDTSCNGICVSGNDPFLQTPCTQNFQCNSAGMADGVCSANATCQEFSVLDIAGSNVFFTGFNVQIRSGSGNTYLSDNGRGNLILGYNENAVPPFDLHDRTGSHNLVIGGEHTYSGNGGIVAGFFNTISGPSASVTGGSFNTASGQNSSVCGGSFNTADNFDASVSGGSKNRALGDASSVSGGSQNLASSNFSSVSGGLGNVAGPGTPSFPPDTPINPFDGPSVSGGFKNHADGIAASVSGGDVNRASGTSSAVSGGNSNTASDLSTSVSGGGFNTAAGPASSVSGGQSNTAAGLNSSVSGGVNNTAGGFASSISGGGSEFVGGDLDWRAGDDFFADR